MLFHRFTEANTEKRAFPLASRSVPFFHFLHFLVESSLQNLLWPQTQPMFFDFSLSFLNRLTF